MPELAPWLDKEEPLPLSTPPAPAEDTPVAPWLQQPDKPVAPWIKEKEKPVETSGPMPGPLDALGAGMKRAYTEAGQSGSVIAGQTPEQVAPDTSPAAQPFEWRDLGEPIGRGLPKLTYQVGQSSPTIAAGVLGGLAGSVAGPAGTVAGGVAGSATGAALQTIGPAFAQELKKHPDDPDGAWDRAVESSVASGAFSGASWAAFPLRFLKGPLKNLAFQAFAVQPGINVAQKATQNVITGEPVTEGLGQSYAQGVVGTAVPALGHMALKGRFGEPESISEAPTPAESSAKAQEYTTQSQDYIVQSLSPNIPKHLAQKLLGKAADLHEAASYELDRHAAPARVQAAITQAEALEQQAQNPNLPLTQHYDLMDQASALRDSAAKDSFISNIPPPLPVREGVLGKIFGRTANAYFNMIDPGSRSEAALKADAFVGKFKSATAQVRDSLQAMANSTYRSKFSAVPWDEQKRFITAFQLDQPLPTDLVTKYPWMANAFPEYREAFQRSYQAEVAMGSKAHYLANYFPQMWEDQKAASILFDPANLVKSMGDTWFQKARDYDLWELGEANGLVPKYKNVQDVVTARLLAGGDMVKKMEMLHDLHNLGVAVPLDEAPAHIRNPAIIGSPYKWEPINAPDRQQWLIAPDIQSLWKNGVEAKGLWENPTAIGDAFRGWMGVKSAWVPIKLGLSLFHPNHVMHIFGAGNMTRALNETFGSGQQGLYRRFIAAPEAMLQSVGDLAFATVPYAPFIGKDMAKAWATPEHLQTPQQAVYTQMMKEAGISAQLSEQLRMKAMESFKDAWAQNKYLSAVPKGAYAGYKSLVGAIFEHWIPSLKLAALAREQAALLRKRPDLINDDVNRTVAMRAIGKQIDNRFGEMFYGGLFWNRTLKDSAIGSFLSLGWNLGFAREFGGGAFEPIARRLMDAPNPTRKLIRDTTTKTTNMFVYSLSAMAINAIMTKALSGNDAQGLDYIFPRIGGLNPDGSPRRITNAFYTREVPMAMKHMEEKQSVVGGLKDMLYNKMMFSPFTQMFGNKDYFGNQIYDENSPFYQQMWQMGKHAMSNEISPMSVAGAKRALELSGKPHDTAGFFKALGEGDRDVVLPMLGFGPAPGYASKSAMDNRIEYLYRQHVAPQERAYELGQITQKRAEARTSLLGAMQRKDTAAIQKASQALANLGVPNASITKIHPGGGTQYMFQRLHETEQRQLLKNMTPEEFRTYYPIYQKHKQKPLDMELNSLAKRYYSPSR